MSYQMWLIFITHAWEHPERQSARFFLMTSRLVSKMFCSQSIEITIVAENFYMTLTIN